ncbi:hypothetical protein ACQ33O_13655 [Ferruginibacter sp. SUN002]|uniref:hypothetical protein n=1 Tax=Ferruginibacter sp. SUN002 TaxID=2937789 RepID=UPI003D36D661
MSVNLKSVRGKVVRNIIPLVAIICMTVLPSLVLGQNPGDNPDAEPQAVPLDPRMTVLLIAAGSFLAMKVMKRMNASTTLQA